MYDACDAPSRSPYRPNLKSGTSAASLNRKWPAVDTDNDDTTGAAAALRVRILRIIASLLWCQ